MKRHVNSASAIIVALLGILPAFALSRASEYLGNNQRDGFVDASIPTEPVLLWTYQERHAPRSAWPEPYGELQFIDFDYADQTTFGHGLVFFGSSADHTIRALDQETGEERWTFYTEGPVRFAPVLHKERLYAVSDDGNLYCLNATEGTLDWKLRLAPGDERCIGEGQMVSKWPCRSGVLIEGDRLYTTAGMWSNDGVIIYCLHADTGEVIWKNDTTGNRWMLLPHASGYGGVAPQGYLALYKDTLYVAAGRSAPAILDATTGKLLFHEIGLGYKPHFPGGSWLMAAHDWVVFKRQHNYKDTDVENTEYQIGRNAEGIIFYNFRTGVPEIATIGGRVLGAAIEDDLILGGKDSVIRINADELRVTYANNRQVGATKGATKYYDPTPLAKWDTDIGRTYTLVIADDTVIAGGKETITLLDVNTGEVLCRKHVDGDVRGLSVSDGRFLASTTSGRFYCFGDGESDSASVVSHGTVMPPDKSRDASKLIEEIDVDAGYCLLLGAGDASLLFDLLRQTTLTVYCIEPNTERRDAIRASLDNAGMLGTRAQLHDGSFGNLPYAPYCANCIIWGDRVGSSAASVDLKGLYRSLRPWGGVAYEYSAYAPVVTSRSRLAAAGIPENEITRGTFGARIQRGPLPGAGEWTRAHGNPGNTFSTADSIVKLPLGILWWGGVGPDRIVTRHWRAPVPLFSKGHMFIQGQHDIIGVDAYTGREMWNRHIRDVGRFPATFRGGNIITDGDCVYCVKGLTCYALDATTGETVRRYTHPLSPEQREEAEKLIPLHGMIGGMDGKRELISPSIVWEFLGMVDDCLIGTLGYDAANITHNNLAIPNQSRYIFAYDKVSGEKAWEIKLDNTVAPTAIVSDQEHLYYIDRTDHWTSYLMRRRSNEEAIRSKLVAVRLCDGGEVWTRDLASERQALFLKNGVIVASANFSDFSGNSNSGLSAFDATNGRKLWEHDRVRARNDRGGPVRRIFIVGDVVYTPEPFDLRTGEPLQTQVDPLTGEPTRFELSGQNFCGTVAACENMIAYRSTALGFKSLTDNSPCYWLSEKRPSCWISLLPAGGMLLSPEGQSTNCTCSFNYKTSAALIPVERHESWGIYRRGPEMRQRIGSAWNGAPIIEGRPANFDQLRINLNAPGDHYDSETGRGFFAWPQATRKGDGFYIVPVSGDAQAEGFRFNSDFNPIAGTKHPWIYSSGLTGDIKLEVLGTEERQYRVVLHFAEPESLGKGDRVFDVLINGEKVFSRLDIVAETGAPKTALAKVITELAPCTTVKIELKSVSDQPALLCGVEVVPE